MAAASDPADEVTRLLAEAHEGRPEALDEVMSLVYDDLRRIARKQLYREQGRGRAFISIQPTELVNESFLKLIKQRKRYDNRGHFFAIATRVMLRVLRDHCRAKRSQKRGGDQVRVSLGAAGGRAEAHPGVEVPALIEALERLETLSPRTAEVTKLRVLWGLTVVETAEALGLSESSVEREWRFARRWLGAELGMDTDKVSGPPGEDEP
jgi:RNA polymerase sigma factor (TIGR02999 family)